MCYFFFLLGSGKAEAPDIPSPAPVTQPVATLACVTASLRVPAQLAGTAKNGINCRPDWPTVTLREYSYHPSTLALSRAKVRSDSAPCLTVGGRGEATSIRWTTAWIQSLHQVYWLWCARFWAHGLLGCCSTPSILCGVHYWGGKAAKSGQCHWIRPSGPKWSRAGRQTTSWFWTETE